MVLLIMKHYELRKRGCGDEMKQIGDIIANKRKEVGMSQAGLADRLERYNISVKNAAISSWEKNTNTPTAYQLLAICEILGIKDIYGEFIGGINSGLLDGLNALGRQRVKEYIDLLKKSEVFVEKKSANDSQGFRHIMPIAVLPASAGTGELISDELFEEQEFDSVPKDAEFGVRLSGDSMEPTFHDGEIVWIRRKGQIRTGEVGLFFLDGMVYCKRFMTQNNISYLVSDNKKYKPILLSEENEFRVFGVVIMEGRI